MNNRKQDPIPDVAIKLLTDLGDAVQALQLIALQAKSAGSDFAAKKDLIRVMRLISQQARNAIGKIGYPKS